MTVTDLNLAAIESQLLPAETNAANAWRRYVNGEIHRSEWLELAQRRDELKRRKALLLGKHPQVRS